MAYLDHAASTPVLPEALAAMTAALAETGNASSLHTAGRRSRRVLEEARETLAAALGARPSEVVFTSGGTESDNLAVKGVFWARREQDARRTRIVCSAVEHAAVLDTVEWLVKHEDAIVTWVPVDALGRVDVDAFADALGPDVAVATVMWANNEVGTVQPVAQLAELARAAGVPFHTDAVQAVGQLPVDFSASGADALTLSGHKLGGPPGSGALLLGRDVLCTPLLHGGGQERDVRSGTLAVPSAVGLATAASVAVARRAETAARLTALREDLCRRVLSAVPDALHNGDPVERLPGNAHFSVPGCEGDSLLLLLDAKGVEVSTGSACSSGVARPSHVLLAMGQDELRARSSLRISLGHTSVSADVDALVEALPAVVERARRVPR